MEIIPITLAAISMPMAALFWIEAVKGTETNFYFLGFGIVFFLFGWVALFWANRIVREKRQEEIAEGKEDGERQTKQT